MKIAIGCDEAAYSLKVEIMKHLDSKGIEYHDFGADRGEIVLYPRCGRKGGGSGSRGRV